MVAATTLISDVAKTELTPPTPTVGASIELGSGVGSQTVAASSAGFIPVPLPSSSVVASGGLYSTPATIGGGKPAAAYTIRLQQGIWPTTNFLLSLITF